MPIPISAFPGKAHHPTVARSVSQKCKITLICVFILSCFSVSYGQINNNFIDYINGDHGTVIVNVPESAKAVLNAPAGTVFTTVNFASYGTPTGVSPNFQINPACHASNSQSVAESKILGTNTAQVDALNGIFGDPCVGTFKALIIVATYTRPICYNSSPGTITGTKPTGGNNSYTYSWEKSTTGPSSGFTAIAGSNLMSYNPGALTTTTWFRRKVTSGASSSYSKVLQVTVMAPPTVPVFATGATSQRCKGAETLTYAATASNTSGITYSLGAASLAGGNTIDPGTGAVTFSDRWTGTTTITATAAGCISVTGTHKVTTYAPPAATLSTAFSCVGGSTGSVVITPSTPGSYSYRLQGTPSFTSSATFTGLPPGTGVVEMKNDGTGCLTSLPFTIQEFPPSSDNQNATGNDTWVAHIYKGRNFETYVGNFTEPEEFDENFSGNTTCFEVQSASETRSIFTEQFSVRFRMNSTRVGLFAIDLGSDDGSRLYIDGNLVYNNWTDQGFSTKANNLVSVSGSSSLVYEFYERTGANRVIFNNGIRLIENRLTVNANQAICLGSVGKAIGGDKFIALPNGISTAGTGYTWGYSLSANGPVITIAGATGATFTPNTSQAPFNNAGTYYVFRTATLQSINNTGFSTYTTSVISPPAMIQVNAAASGTFSYPDTLFCNGTSDKKSAFMSATPGGTFTALPAGLAIQGSTGVVDPAASQRGRYMVSYSVQPAGCPQYTVSKKLQIVVPGEWSGKVNSDWENPQNWYCQQIPDKTVDVVIANSASDPCVNYAGAVRDLRLEEDASLMIHSTLKITGGIFAAPGKINASGGTIEMAGSRAQAISGSVFFNKEVKNLIVNNSGPGLSVSATPGDTLKISGRITFANDSANLFTGDNLTLLSTHGATARVGKLTPDNSIVGKAIVERYINTGLAAGQHGKSWQFLATSATGQTIRQTWMEDGSIVNGYGIQLTGPSGVGGGFDRSSPAPAIKYYNSETDKWVGINSANTPIYNQKGYMVFIRGDRTVNGTSVTAPNPTVLRTKGYLMTGRQQPIAVKAGKLESVGNPYASPIDFSMIEKDAGIDNKFYVWDPYLGGVYGLGGYQTITEVANWRPVPGGTPVYKSEEANKTIGSGQAFFVHATETGDIDATYYLTITEQSKSDEEGTSFARKQSPSGDKRQFFSVSLFAGTDQNAPLVDGNIVAFDNRFSNVIDGNDAPKFFNAGENFGVRSEGRILSVEARQSIPVTDTIVYEMSNMQPRTYQLRFAPEEMHSPDLEIFLVDKFLNSRTPLSTVDTSYVTFRVTSDKRSSAANRFNVVFSAARILPVTITAIKAYEKDGQIELLWHVQNESAIRTYEVESSVDGTHFNKAATLDASGKIAYLWRDMNPQPGFHYYRIRAIGLDGMETVTQIVRVLITGKSGDVFVFPNPITNNTIHLYLNNQPGGTYQVSLINAGAQTVLSKILEYQAAQIMHKISVPSSLPAGIYYLEVAGPGTARQMIRIAK